MNEKEYIQLSLELHLFFDRIMKEHSFFLEAAFLEKNSDFKLIANDFHKKFSDILEKVIRLADGNISNELLISNEIVTNYTLEAENQTSNLTGADLNTDLTLKQLELKSGNINVSDQLINDIHSINIQTLPLIEDLINFKNEVLNQVLSCKIYTTNYPLLIAHIMNEAKMYHNLLTKIENREMLTSSDLYEQELFWNNIMREHAEFIRGLLDPSEQELILMSDRFSNDYEAILKNYVDTPLYLTDISLNETINFRNFKISGVEGILNCKIKSIIIPLLADHVLREANHFIRILNKLSLPF